MKRKNAYQMLLLIIVIAAFFVLASIQKDGLGEIDDGNTFISADGDEIMLTP